MEDRNQTLLDVGPPIATVFAPDSYSVPTYPINDFRIALKCSLNAEVICELRVFKVLENECSVKD